MATESQTRQTAGMVLVTSPATSRVSRYDARGNVVDTGVHTDSLATSTAVVPAPVIRDTVRRNQDVDFGVVLYAIYGEDGRLYGVARESEIEALFDTFQECYPDVELELVQC